MLHHPNPHTCTHSHTYTHYIDLYKPHTVVQSAISKHAAEFTPSIGNVSKYTAENMEHQAGTRYHSNPVKAKWTYNAISGYEVIEDVH